MLVANPTSLRVTRRKDMRLSQTKQLHDLQTRVLTPGYEKLGGIAIPRRGTAFAWVDQTRSARTNMPIDLKPLLSEQDDIIFVVEGDEVVRSALNFILNDQNETHSFANLDQAFAKATDLTPNIVLLGIGFLQDNGEMVLAEVATRLSGSRILIVANSVNDPIARASLRWGAHDVLGKPISFDSVRGKVDALLDRHELSPTMPGLLPQSATW
jgi:ActR/RegA family two-component response regulator